MKLAFRLLLALAALVFLAAAIAYIDGATLPVDHATTVTGTVAAPPEAVFARIVDIANGPRWRPAVQKVTVLPPDNGRDHWIEDLGHGQTMTFLATNTVAPTRREVLLDVPGAAYGGTWTYELAPGPTPGTTTLRITETGYIRPPMYRFIMRHIIGMTSNLDRYLADMQAAVAKQAP